MTKLFISVLLAAAVLAPYQALAYEYEARSFLREVDTILEDPPPSITEVVPGYRARSQAGPSLIVADLETRAEDKRDWGKALGRILRWNLMFSHRTSLRLPDFNYYYQDANSPEILPQDIGRSLTSVGLVAKRLGIGHALTGTVAISGRNFELELALRTMPTGEIVRTHRFSGPLEQLPETLLRIPSLIDVALGVPDVSGQPATQVHAAQFTLTELEKFVGAVSGDMSDNKERVRRLWMEGVTNPLTAAHYLYYMEVGTDMRSYFNRLEDVHSLFPENPGIEFTVAQYMGYQNLPDLLDIKLGRMRKIVSENPHDPVPMLVLCDTLAYSGRYLDSLSVCREALLRFPASYRVWWSMSFALLEYGGHLRGTSYWVDVSPKGKRMFPALKELAGRGVAKALALNDQNSTLWVLKMRTIGQYNQEFMDSFHTAIRLMPTNRAAYEMAINFTLPQWGGSPEAQDEVLELAEKNVADPAWLKHIREQYVSDRSWPLIYWAKWLFKSLVRALANPLNAILALLGLIAVAVVILRLRQR